MSNDASPPAPRFFHPITLLIGVVLGLALLGWAGRRTTRFDWHGEFTRFHPMMAPESQYLPTMGEMRAIVRSHCRPDQVLVIVGGNSILQGVGQPADQMWTRHLQEQLGDRYVVINFAFRGSSPTDGGALVSESLFKEFPRQIYIANTAPMQAANAIGISTYRFLLFEARAKHLLMPWQPREDALRAEYAQPALRNESTTARAREWIDAQLYAHDFWNWWSFTRFFTFPTPIMPALPEAFRARRLFPDAENDFNTMPFETRFSAATVESDMKIARLYTEPFYLRDADGAWQLRPAAQAQFHDFARGAFPDALKPRTLLVVNRNSPYYTQRLPQEIRQRDDLAVADSIANWKSAGYDAVDVGKNYTAEDYGDRTHLTTSGGAKLAAVVAAEVQAMAVRLHYLDQPAH